MFRIDKILLDTLQKLVTSFTDFIPNLINGILVFVIGFFLAKGVRFVVAKLLKNAGIDTLGEKINELDSFKKFNIKVVFSTLLSSIVYYFIILIFLSEATRTIGLKVLNDLVTSFINQVPKYIVAGILLICGLILADMLQKTVISICKSLNIAAGKLIGGVVFFFIFAITIIAALGQAGINTSLLESSFNLIVAGVIFAFAFGYGLASKDVLANIVAAFYSKDKFKVGQSVEFEGIKGIIETVDQTCLIINDGTGKISIPLQNIQQKNIKIFS